LPDRRQELGVPYHQATIISFLPIQAAPPDAGPVSAAVRSIFKERAVIQACEDLKAQFFPIAAELLGQKKNACLRDGYFKP